MSWSDDFSYNSDSCFGTSVKDWNIPCSGDEGAPIMYQAIGVSDQGYGDQLVSVSSRSLKKSSWNVFLLYFSMHSITAEMKVVPLENCLFLPISSPKSRGWPVTWHVLCQEWISKSRNVLVHNKQTNWFQIDFKLILNLIKQNNTTTMISINIWTIKTQNYKSHPLLHCS